mgnify:CR=1 FL=1
MDKDELRAWLRLSMTEGVGNDAARRLLACFGSPQAVFEQAQAGLSQVVTPKQAQALLSVPNELAVQCVRTQQWLRHPPDTHHHALWTLGDAHYPAELLQLAPGQRVLDACCAPGGKTCHLLEVEPQLAHVVGVDLEAKRLVRVRENLARLGLEAEVPEPGCYKTTYIGEQSVLLTRAEDGTLHAMLNRCAHRGNDR